jgi:type III restriction enzyme
VQRSYGPLFESPEGDGASPSVDIEVREVPDLNALPPDVRSKVTADASKGTITYRGSMDDAEREALKSCLNDPDVQYQVDQAQQRIREKIGGTVKSPAEQGEPFEVPRLAVRQGDAFETFRETHFLDTDWSLSSFDATLPSYEPSLPQGQRGEVDTGDEGHLSIRFLNDVRRQLSLLSDDGAWEVADVVMWLDRNIPHQDIRPQDAITFLERLVQGYLIDEKGFSLDALVRDKYRLKRAVEKRIDEHRRTAHQQQYNHLLFGGDGEAAISVDPDICFQFGQEYPYTSLYDGPYKFCKHYYGSKTIGQMNQEEAECAFFLDQQPEIAYWVRNLEQNQKYAFWLQTATGKFYPDFVCKVKDGRILVVEYKGAHLWEDAKPKRNLGRVWAKRSGGSCLFVMLKEKNFDAIRHKLK